MRRARLLALVASVLVLVVSGAPSSTTAGPLVAAHRGGALLWPENSLLAYRSALALGVAFLETDVHLTADGEVVVMHDPTLDRTSTGKGAIRDARAGDLAGVRLRAADGRVTDEPIPTLAQLLDLIAPSPIHLLLEIKVGPDRARYPGIEEKVLAMVRARGLVERVVIMAFETPTVERIRALDATVRTALLVSRARVERSGGSPREAVRWATDARATELGIDHRVLDAAVVAAARAAGVRVAAWTVNEEADLRRVIGLGVDVVISDRPDLARRLAQE
jgi:glycerophosphoryl diester phosphodiesterase